MSSLDSRYTNAWAEGDVPAGGAVCPDCIGARFTNATAYFRHLCRHHGGSAAKLAGSHIHNMVKAEAKISRNKTKEQPVAAVEVGACGDVGGWR
jgi:hypothetical protein